MSLWITLPILIKNPAFRRANVLFLSNESFIFCGDDDGDDDVCDSDVFSSFCSAYQQKFFR